MAESNKFQHNLSSVKQRIATAAQSSGRSPEDIRLVAVGKRQPIDCIQEALEAGAGIIGENYIQEAREKFDRLNHLDTQWHFIGHLQRNKAKYAVRMFDLIHSVDSIRLAAELDQQAKKIAKIQPILLQVNISGESTKSGITEDQSIELANDILSLENLSLGGLMTMPPFFDAPEQARPFFSGLRFLRDRMERELSIQLKELSMGMTGDFEVAVEEGATLVRIGTALFGERL